MYYNQFLIRGFFNRTRRVPFTSDDFRKYKLEDFLDSKPQSSIGNFFLYLKEEGLIEELGRKKSEIPSNRGRKIGVYRWTRLAHARFG